jgi:hypothetical protein
MNVLLFAGANGHNVNLRRLVEANDNNSLFVGAESHARAIA